MSTELMNQTSTISRILSDSEQGLLPYLLEKLNEEKFTHFRSQFLLNADHSSTKVSSGSSSLQTTLSLSLKFSIIVDSHTSPDDAIILALEFQELIDTCLLEWSQQNPYLGSPLAQIDGSFGRLEEVRYHGGFLPGLGIERNFNLIYNTNAAEEDDRSDSNGEALYKPGEIVPESGLYELTGPRGGSKGQEVTATKGEPFPPTPEPGLRYKLVISTRHKS